MKMGVRYKTIYADPPWYESGGGGLSEALIGTTRL